MCSAGGILPLGRNSKCVQFALRGESLLACSGIGFGGGKRVFSQMEEHYEKFSVIFAAAPK